jgi:preprotein translocase subunit YajC
VEVLIPLAILFAFFWFFVMLPQRRKQRAHTEMQDALGTGDEIITAGGMHGTVTGVDETTVRLEIAPDTIVLVDRRAVAARVAAEHDPEHEAVESVSANDENPG